MADVLVVVAAVAFFALAALYVTACDRLVGRDGIERSAAGPGEDEARSVAR